MDSPKWVHRNTIIPQKTNYSNEVHTRKPHELITGMLNAHRCNKYYCPNRVASIHLIRIEIRRARKVHTPASQLKKLISAERCADRHNIFSPIYQLVQQLYLFLSRSAHSR